MKKRAPQDRTLSSESPDSQARLSAWLSLRGEDNDSQSLADGNSAEVRG